MLVITLCKWIIWTLRHNPENISITIDKLSTFIEKLVDISRDIDKGSHAREPKNTN